MQEDAIRFLRCPVCRSAMHRQENSLLCEKRHCFDVARQGDVNLAPGKKESFYTKELFLSRAKVFECGIFDPVIDEITRAVHAHARDARVLLDAGCGEGYYTRRVCEGKALTRLGFDLSKEAIRLAAKSDKGGSYFVGDLANIPLQDGCADVLLDVFTPANYAEFGRVLKRGGLLIKLAPRSGYLAQLREAAQSQLRHTHYDGGKVEDYAKERMNLIEHKAITYTLPVTQETVFHLARMTPMLAGVDMEKLDLSGVTQITIDETMYVGTIQ